MPCDERGQHQGAESKPDDRHCAAKTIREANGSRAEQNHHSVVKEISAVINNSGLLDSVQLMESGLINFLHGVFLCLPGAMRFIGRHFLFHHRAGTEEQPLNAFDRSFSSAGPLNPEIVMTAKICRAQKFVCSILLTSVASTRPIMPSVSTRGPCGWPSPACAWKATSRHSSESRSRTRLHAPVSGDRAGRVAPRSKGTANACRKPCLARSSGFAARSYVAADFYDS